jgi:hypothetical protein
VIDRKKIFPAQTQKRKHRTLAMTQTRESNRRRMFARMIALEPVSYAEGARRTGYSHKAARQIAHKLTKDDAVSSLVQEYRAKADSKALRTAQEHVERLNQLGKAAEADKQYAAAIKAETQIGMVAGLYAKDTAKAEDMAALSLDALLNKLAFLRAKSPELIDLVPITPDTGSETEKAKPKPKKNGKR